MCEEKRKGLFVLYTQHPKEKEIGIGCIAIDEKRRALFMSPDGREVLLSMERVSIDFAAKNGIMLSGFEEYNKANFKYRFQRWWLIYA